VSIQEPSVSSPDDFATFESVHSFSLDLIRETDPCTLTVFDKFTLVNMLSSVLGNSATQDFDDLQDSESKTSGDNSGTTHCGPRVYSLVGTSAPITLDSATRTIVLKSIDLADIG
jgi:hypothetical protein